MTPLGTLICPSSHILNRVENLYP